MIRSLVTQMAAARAASGPAVLAIELGKPAVGGGAAGDVWVARKLLRRGSSRGVNSGSRRYHNFNLYCADFGPFLAAAVAQAAGAVASKWARYRRRSKLALTAKVCPPATQERRGRPVPRGRHASDVARVAPYGRDTRQERGHRPAGHRHLRGATLAARGVVRRAWETRPRTRTCMESSVWSD